MLNTLILSLLLSLLGQVPADKPSAGQAQAEESSRKVWLEMIGNWRVTGQPKRGSASGAWVTKGRVGWSKVLREEGIALKNDRPAELSMVLPQSRLWQEAGIVFDPASKKMLGLSIVEKDTAVARLYKHIPQADSARFVFEYNPEKGSSDDARRLTFDRRTSDRWTILAEIRRPDAKAWSRQIDLGMTREGTTIAIGDGQKKCIVTGGLGDIEVTVLGKTVYVCCSGCREALLDDPDSFLKPAQPAAAGTGKEAVKP